MPDIPSARYGAVFLVIIRNFNPVQNPLGGGDLIGPHDHQHLLGGKNAIPRQYVQNGMSGEKCTGKVYQIRQDLVVGIGPEGGKLKAVAGLFLSGGRGGSGVPDGVPAGGVGVIFGVRAVGNDKNLHIVIEAAACPEAVPLVTADLIERLPDGYAPALQLDMDQGQAVHQDRHIVAVVIPRPVLFANGVLVDDLEAVIVDALFVDEGDVLALAGVPPEDLHKVLLDAAGLVFNAVVGVGDALAKKPLPLGIGEGVVVQLLQLFAEVGSQLRLGVDGKILVPLSTEQADKFLFQRGLALVAVGTGLDRFVFCDYRVFGGLGNDVKVAHAFIRPPQMFLSISVHTFKNSLSISPADVQ